MANSTQSSINKWDQRYLDKTTAGEPCWLLINFSHLLPTEGKALDLACGLGANALHLARKGLNSHGWDSSKVALQKLSEFAEAEQLTISTLLRNVEQQPPEANSFDVIVVSHFLYRPMLPALVNALRPKGLLFYQTFNLNKPSHTGPSNPDFLLNSNELLEAFSDLRTVYYREEGALGDTAQGLRNCSYYIGCKANRV